MARTDQRNQVDRNTRWWGDKAAAAAADDDDDPPDLR